MLLSIVFVQYLCPTYLTQIIEKATRNYYIYSTYLILFAFSKECPHLRSRWKVRTTMDSQKKGHYIYNVRSIQPLSL